MVLTTPPLALTQAAAQLPLELALAHTLLMKAVGQSDRLLDGSALSPASPAGPRAGDAARGLANLTARLMNRTRRGTFLLLHLPPELRAPLDMGSIARNRIDPPRPPADAAPSSTPPPAWPAAASPTAIPPATSWPPRAAAPGPAPAAPAASPPWPTAAAASTAARAPARRPPRVSPAAAPPAGSMAAAAAPSSPCAPRPPAAPAA